MPRWNSRPRPSSRLGFSLLFAGVCLPAFGIPFQEASGQQLPGVDGGQRRPVDSGQSRERTSFQTRAPWNPMLQLPADVAMCYGVGPDLRPRIQQWKDRGLLVHVMTGVAWGITRITSTAGSTGRSTSMRPRPTAGVRSSPTATTTTTCAPDPASATSWPSGFAGRSRPARRPSTWKSRSSGPEPGTARDSSGPGRPTTARTGFLPTPRPTPSIVRHA